MKPILLLLALTTFSCTWVNENPAGQSIAITDRNINCQQVGKISVSTKHKIGFVRRSSKKVLDELQTLARNEALKIGANTIQPQSEPIDGKQSYIAYACPR